MKPLCEYSRITLIDSDFDIPTHRFEVNCRLTGELCPAYVAWGGEETAHRNASSTMEQLIELAESNGFDARDMADFFYSQWKSIEDDDKRYLFTRTFVATLFNDLIAESQAMLIIATKCNYDET